MSNTINIVVDIETLSTKADGVILTLGVVPFNPAATSTFSQLIESGLHIAFDKQIQLEKGRTVTQDTIDWWDAQGGFDEELLKGAISPADLHEALQPIYELLSANQQQRKHTRWWSRGNAFDIAMLDHLANQFSIESPWRFYNVRDVRTACDFANKQEWDILVRKPKKMHPHNALHDAAYDVMRLQYVYKVRPW